MNLVYTKDATGWGDARADNGAGNWLVAGCGMRICAFRVGRRRRQIVVCVSMCVLVRCACMCVYVRAAAQLYKMAIGKSENLLLARGWWWCLLTMCCWLAAARDDCGESKRRTTAPMYAQNSNKRALAFGDVWAASGCLRRDSPNGWRSMVSRWVGLLAFLNACK